MPHPRHLEEGVAVSRRSGTVASRPVLGERGRTVWDGRFVDGFAYTWWNQQLTKWNGRMAKTETFKVSTSGQMSLPATVRHRWQLDDGGFVEVIDLGFGVLTVPVGEAGRLLLPAADHYAAVAAEDDPDLLS